MKVSPPIPRHILLHHSVVIFGIDVLSTISRIIKLGKSMELLNTKVPTLVVALLVIVDTYTSMGFSIIAIVADYSFETTRENDDFMDTCIRLNKYLRMSIRPS